MLRYFFHPLFLFLSWDPFAIFVQITEEVYVAEEWVDDARNEARAEASRLAEANKALGVVEHKNKELATKLAVEKSLCLRVEVGLKNVEAQVEDQHKKLHITEIELAT